MFKLIHIENIKTFYKWRTGIGFLAIGVLLPLMMIGMSLDIGHGPSAMAVRAVKNLSENFFIVGSIFNGFSAAYFVMNSLWVLIPFLIALVAGDQIAGESAAGTFRISLIRSTSRTQIISAKFITTLIYTVLLILFLGLLSIGIGILLFGRGDFLVPRSGEILVLLEGQTWLRFGLAYLLAIWAMWTVASLAFFLSTLAENSLGPVIGTMAIVIACLIISRTPLQIFNKVKPFLFTTYVDGWQKAFQEPIPWYEINSGVLYLAIYILGFFALSLIVFNQKDILS
jgi:ABC-2 type transport system permease protein